MLRCFLRLLWLRLFSHFELIGSAVGIKAAQKISWDRDIQKVFCLHSLVVIPQYNLATNLPNQGNFLTLPFFEDQSTYMVTRQNWTPEKRFMSYHMMIVLEEQITLENLSQKNLPLSHEMVSMTHLLCSMAAQRRVLFHSSAPYLKSLAFVLSMTFRVNIVDFPWKLCRFFLDKCYRVNRHDTKIVLELV